MASIRRFIARDCVEVAQHVGPASVDLVVMDPPYCTGRDFGDAYSDTWGHPDEAEFLALPERLRGLIALLAEVHTPMGGYLTFMARRLIQISHVMRPTAGLYSFCDDHANGYLRVILDAVLGPRNFRNELVWRRSATQPAKQWAKDLDRVLFYRRPGVGPWTQPWLPYTEEQEDRFRPISELGIGRPDDHRRAALNQCIHPLSWNAKGDHHGEFMGVRPPPGRCWRWTLEGMQEKHRDGKLVRKGGKLFELQLRADARGCPHGSLLAEPMLGGSESIGYETQKPTALLRRLIEASSFADHVILDPFCGSGSTLVAAETTHRQWIGMDVGAKARATAIPRLEHECHGLFGGKIEIVE